MLTLDEHNWSWNRFGNNKVEEEKRRDNEHNAFTLSSQPTRTYETVQNVVLETFTFEKEKDVEKVKEGDIVSNHTSIVIETELVGNEEGLYDVTGKLPMKITPGSTIEEESNSDVFVHPTSHNTETEKMNVHSNEKMDIEVGSYNYEETQSAAESADEETESVAKSVDEEIESSDEETVIQTNQRDVAEQSREYNEITMSHGIKKSMNIVEEIYDVTMVPPATSDDLISTEEEDTGSSSGYEEGSNGSQPYFRANVFQ